jgi:hypothetical protein
VWRTRQADVGPGVASEHPPSETGLQWLRAEEVCFSKAYILNKLITRLVTKPNNTQSLPTTHQLVYSVDEVRDLVLQSVKDNSFEVVFIFADKDSE